jgi:hypothetical protein
VSTVLRDRIVRKLIQNLHENFEVAFYKLDITSFLDLFEKQSYEIGLFPTSFPFVG